MYLHADHKSSLNIFSHLVTLYFLAISTEYENNEKCQDFKLIGKNTYIDYENDNQTEETFRIECEEKMYFLDPL